MKKFGWILLSMLALSGFGGYDVKRPTIEPRWTGAVTAEWTMDRAAALDAAKRNGKWTLVLVSGAWWCPWCQPFEEKVLDTDAWRSYAVSRVFYEIMMDYPYRDGVQNFCWLWDSSYQEKIQKP